jgi:hypothetical protein
MIKNTLNSLEETMPKLMKVLSAIAQECFLIIKKRGLEFIATDDDLRCQVSISLAKELIEEWHIKSEHILKVNIDIIRNIFYSKQPITGIRDLEKSVVEIKFGKTKYISLYILDEGHQNKLKLIKPRKGRKLFSMRLSSMDLKKFLKIASNALDELIFEVTDGGGLQIRAEYLNCYLSSKIEPVSIRKTTNGLRFSVPMKYLRILAPLLDLSKTHSITLMDNNVLVIEVSKSARIKCKANITSLINTYNSISR